MGIILVGSGIGVALVGILWGLYDINKSLREANHLKKIELKHQGIPEKEIQEE